MLVTLVLAVALALVRRARVCLGDSCNRLTQDTARQQGDEQDHCGGWLFICIHFGLFVTLADRV
jgi:hypothetical protein